MSLASVFCASLLFLVACDDGGGGGGTAADQLGIGATCGEDAGLCGETAVGDAGLTLQCLAFKGGYCGLEGCALDDDCPAQSACVRHDDGETYCFRVCVDKAECNANRPAAFESNCSSNVDFADPDHVGNKACVPPSGR